jgi:hypothetical protein
LQKANSSEDINRAWENIKENIKTKKQKKVRVCMNGSNINHGLVMNVDDFCIKGSWLKCSGYGIQTKAMQIM